MMSSQRNRYEELCGEYEQLNTRIDCLQIAYPEGFPQLSDLSAMDAVADRLAVLESRIASQPADLQSMQISAPEQACLEKRVPAQEELEDCRRACDALTALQQRLQEAEPALSAKMKEREILALQQKGPATAGVFAAWIVSALCISGAIILMVTEQILFAGIAFCVGVVAAAAALRLLRGGRKMRAQLLQRQAALDMDIETAHREIGRMHRSSEQHRTQIAQFLAEFGIHVPPHQYPAGLARLEHNLQLFESAKLWKSRRMQLEEDAAECRVELDNFFIRYRQDPGADARIKLRQMREDLYLFQMLQVRKQELAERLAQQKQEFSAASAILSVPQDDIPALKQQEENLRDRQTTLTERLLHQKQQLQLLQSRTGRIPALRDELARAQERLAEGREKVRLLDETVMFLQQARQSLSTAYLGTIRSRFEGYLAQLETATGEKVFVDTDLQVQLERMGQTRELAYFSAGMTDLVMLCMRLALVDALFREEDIFVILDDPFVNLDDVRTAQAAKLLERLAQHRQILYLTCHSSRSV